MLSVVFDLDGTLADTSGDLIASANSVFTRHGLSAPLHLPQDYRLAHQGGRAMIAAGMDRLNMDDPRWAEWAYQELLWCYSRDVARHTVLYDGVLDALNNLAMRGYLLGICTNKPISLALDLIDQLGISAYFGAILGANSLPVRKPDPIHLWATIDAMGGARDHAVLIGDTKTDFDTARNAALPSVLVRFGPNGQTLNQLGADAYIDHYDQLLDVLDKLQEKAQ